MMPTLGISSVSVQRSHLDGWRAASAMAQEAADQQCGSSSLMRLSIDAMACAIPFAADAAIEQDGPKHPTEATNRSRRAQVWNKMDA